MQPALFLLALAQFVASAVDAREGIGFGRAVCALPDFDGDGVTDFAVGAPFDSHAGERAGAVYLFSGARPELRRVVDGPSAGAAIGKRIDRIARCDGGGALLVASDGAPRSRLYSQDSELLREFEPELGELSPAGDWNGDGDEDLFATTRDPVAVLCGVCFRELVAWTDVSAASVLGTPGDLEGDGRAELVLRGSLASDRAWLRYGSEHLAPLELRVPLRRWNGFELEACGPWVVAPGGDLDGDGRGDLLVGLPFSLEPYGRALAFSGRDGRVLFDSFGAELVEREGDRPEGFGAALLGGFDLDGDGRDEFLVGAPSAFLGPAAISAFSAGASAPRWTLELRDLEREHLGTSLALLDDRDGDGVPDVLAGGADTGDSGGVSRTGHVRILSGCTGCEPWAFGVGELPSGR